MKILYLFYCVFCEIIPTFFWCLISGLPFDLTWKIKGRIYIINRKWYDRYFRGIQGGSVKIGKHFNCNNAITSNTIGLIQPCIFDIVEDGSSIIIGNNVGISGSTINATLSVVIEDNVLIGSGCIITDTDSHPILYNDRIKDDKSKTNRAPILIKEGVFIGARSIILKGVTIGKYSVVGAGSVISKDVPDNCIVAGNPAKVIKYL